MTETIPQMGPGGAPQVQPGPLPIGIGAASVPTAVPPPGAVSMAAKGDCTCGGSAGGGISAAAALPPSSISDSVPSVSPTTGVSAGVTAWLNDKRVIGLWSINQNRNSFVYVDGIGWKKLANNSDSAIVALTMLGAHAREKASRFDYREESDGMIHEIYAW